MTLDEFSVEFDLMYNNITSNQAPGLTQLEKSIFLTQAQELLIKEFYKGNSIESFESTEEIAQYLSPLVYQKDFSSTDKDNSANSIFHTGTALKSTVFTLPANDKIMFIVYESAKLKGPDCSNIKETIVVPTTHDEFYKIYRNPFRGPSDKRILRLLFNGKVELISTKDIESYKIRYIKVPSHITLIGASAYNISPYTEAQGQLPILPESLHRNILMQAVSLAKAAWASR